MCVPSAPSAPTVEQPGALAPSTTALDAILMDRGDRIAWTGDDHVAQAAIMAERDGLKDTLTELGIGSIAFTPLAQGMLTRKYLGGIPEDSRAAQDKSLFPSMLSEKAIGNIRKLNEIAEARGQTLAQMAIAWVLRGGGITTALIGASKPSQVIDCVGAVGNLEFTEEELKQIDEYADEEQINLWASSAEIDG